MGKRGTRRAGLRTRLLDRATSRPCGAQAGFSLVEVLIAAVVLAVAITGISGSILSSPDATARSAARWSLQSSVVRIARPPSVRASMP